MGGWRPGTGEGARAENAILVIDDRRDASILTNIDAAGDATLLSFHDRYSGPDLSCTNGLAGFSARSPSPRLDGFGRNIMGRDRSAVGLKTVYVPLYSLVSRGHRSMLAQMLNPGIIQKPL